MIKPFRRVREHLYFYTRSSIHRILELSGFRVEEIRFHGHTFRLEFLAERLRVPYPLLGAIMTAMVRTVRFGKMQIHLNPATKMVVYARKVRTV